MCNGYVRELVGWEGGGMADSGCMQKKKYTSISIPLAQFSSIFMARSFNIHTCRHT